MKNGVEAVGGFQVGHVAYAVEDLKAGVRDGLLHELCGLHGAVGVLGSDDDEGWDGDVPQGCGVVLALGSSSEGGGGSGGWGMRDHRVDVQGQVRVLLDGGGGEQLWQHLAAGQG